MRRLDGLVKYEMEIRDAALMRNFSIDDCTIQIERTNFLLHSLVDMVRKGEKPEGRLMTHMLYNPSDDGGKESLKPGSQPVSLRWQLEQPGSVNRDRYS